MPVPRPRLTLRRWMIIIIATALLLAVFLQVIGWRQRQVLIDQLRAEIAVYQIAQAEKEAMAEQARQRHDSPEDVRSQEQDLVELRKEVVLLRQKLARLQR
jgi:hypothetical protein